MRAWEEVLLSSYTLVSIILAAWLILSILFALVWVLNKYGRSNDWIKKYGLSAFVVISFLEAAALIFLLLYQEPPANSANTGTAMSVGTTSVHDSSAATTSVPLTCTAADPMPTPDLWINPAFQEAMTTLWAAPLTILAIVFAVVGIAGWQGYKDIRQRLEDELSNRVQYVTDLTIAAGDVDAALVSWKLAMSLARQESRISESAIDKEFPPAAFAVDSSAQAHIKAAKGFAEKAVNAFKRVPDHINVTVRGRSKEVLRIEVLQSYAYYIATDAKTIAVDARGSQAMWDEALTYSRMALRVLEDSAWVKQESLNIREVGPRWRDTFIYVRVIYARENQSPTASTEYGHALNLYKDLVENNNPDDRETIERFQEVFPGIFKNWTPVQ